MKSMYGNDSLYAKVSECLSEQERQENTDRMKIPYYIRNPNAIILESRAVPSETC